MQNSLTNSLSLISEERLEQERGKWILKIAPVCILHLAFVGEQSDERVFYSLLLNHVKLGHSPTALTETSRPKPSKTITFNVKEWT